MQESRADLIVVLIPAGVVGLLRTVQTGATREEINREGYDAAPNVSALDSFVSFVRLTSVLQRRARHGSWSST
jgi:hypothetical protein